MPVHNSERLAALSTRTWDMVIIGGGIQGAGIAREAALRGLRVVLFEKGDFASGTSGKTSSLIHGGLRYLEQGDIRLVYEAVCERYALSRLAPHLIKPLPFLFPIYRGGRKKITVQIGVGLYDLLAGKKSFGRFKFLAPEQVQQLEPSLASKELLGAARFFDCRMDDARLCLTVLLTAQDHGATLFNYTEVIGLIPDQGKICGVTVKAAGETYPVRGTVVINATGAWSDQVCQMERDRLAPTSQTGRIRPTKGIHIVVPRLTDQHAVVLSSGTSRRIFFVIPWRGYSLIGTTDTDYAGDLNHVIPTPEEIQMLLEETVPFFPSVQASVLGSFAALRPLIGQETKSPWDRSRQEQIEWTPGGMLVIRGGKFTLFRRIALRVMDAVLKRHRALPVVTRPDPEPPLHGSQIDQESMQSESSPPALLSYLVGAYGTDYKAILKMAESDPHLSTPLTPLGYPLTAEVIHAVRNEYARHLSDFMLRRTRLGHGPYKADLSLIQILAKTMGAELGWSPDEMQGECDAYLKNIDS